jgi:hypothetical protein
MGYKICFNNYSKHWIHVTWIKAGQSDRSGIKTVGPNENLLDMSVGLTYFGKSGHILGTPGNSIRSFAVPPLRQRPSKVLDFYQPPICWRQPDLQKNQLRSLNALALQEDLGWLQEWERNWMMSFKPSKFEVLHITKKRNPIIHAYMVHQ